MNFSVRLLREAQKATLMMDGIQEDDSLVRDLDCVCLARCCQNFLSGRKLGFVQEAIHLSFSELNCIESTESIEFVEDYY